MLAAANGTEVLNWFISITSASFFTNWAIIAFSSFHFRAAIRAQRSQLFETPYAWRSLYWPLAPVTSLFISSLLLVCLLYTSIKPVVSLTSLELLSRRRPMLYILSPRTQHVTDHVH